MNWYRKVIQQYAVFNGRARRKEYWMFALCNLIFGMAAAFFDRMFGLHWENYDYGPISQIYSLLVLVPALAVAVRRLHDVGKSGWTLLVLLIPLIGAIWILILLTTEGDRGINQYGPNPKEAALWSE